MLRSLKGVYKAPSVRAVFRLGPSPYPGPGAGVELGGGHPGSVVDRPQRCRVLNIRVLAAISAANDLHQTALLAAAAFVLVYVRCPEPSGQSIH
jgi:hypothetical protein